MVKARRLHLEQKPRFIGAFLIMACAKRIYTLGALVVSAALVIEAIAEDEEALAAQGVAEVLVGLTVLSGLWLTSMTFQ